MLSARHIAYLAFLCALSGCFPTSCQRERHTALLPSDSLSRQIASQTPADTLRPLWQTSGSEMHSLEFPRTVRFGPDPPGHLFVSDVERNSVFEFTADGRFVREITDEAFDIPYLAGMRGDTLVVFSAGADRIDFVADGRRVGPPLRVSRPTREALFYVTASDTALYAKVVGENANDALARIGSGGALVDRVPLPGPYWRHAGFLRIWADSLLSLSGFRPVVDVLPLGFTSDTPVDTMALRGFDSPMQARSRAFVKGEVNQPPLLTPSATPVGGRLFVINLRPGWLQIDTYDHVGRLQRRLSRPRQPRREYYPHDLAVRRQADGTYLLAVVRTAPDPRLGVYRWTPPDGSAALDTMTAD